MAVRKRIVRKKKKKGGKKPRKGKNAKKEKDFDWIVWNGLKWTILVLCSFDSFVQFVLFCVCMCMQSLSVRSCRVSIVSFLFALFDFLWKLQTHCRALCLTFSRAHTHALTHCIWICKLCDSGVHRNLADIVVVAVFMFYVDFPCQFLCVQACAGHFY